jgi:hypothetical protein
MCVGKAKQAILWRVGALFIPVHSPSLGRQGNKGPTCYMSKYYL